MKVKDLINKLQQLDLEKEIFMGSMQYHTEYRRQGEFMGISMDEFDIEEHLYDKKHSFTMLEDTIEENIDECYVII